MALEQNQNHFLEAIRLFIELDISASAIDGSKGNTEQKLFVHMLKKAQESSLFRFPQTPSREKLKEIVVSLAKKDDESPTVPGTPAPIPELEAQIAEATAAETPALESSEEERLDAEAAETKRQAKAKEEYLAQKISTKLLHLEASQISLLQNNGIKTIADFMAQTENSFASMKVKKGIPFTARFLKEQETIRCKLENL